MADDFTHLDDEGHVRMVDVGSKDPTQRHAVAEATVVMSEGTRDRLFSGDLPKGDAMATVRLAAIQGAKRTPDLVPLAHPLAIDAISVEIEATDTGARITVSVSVTAKTGVEMEAITGAAIGAIALYDMIKGLDRGAEIASVRLLEKRGGKSGSWRRG
ncbi:MAG: cyclic pyranopterin monophosphate synthase MoaC [Acidimicrobiia bacterium]